jgi:hypothetical protein
MLDFLILAARGAAQEADTGKGMSLEWAIVLFFMLLGLGITLSPPKRTSEIKKQKEK